MTLNKDDVRPGLQFVYANWKDVIYTVWRIDENGVHCTHSGSEVDYVYSLTSLVSYFSTYTLLPVWSNH